MGTAALFGIGGGRRPQPFNEREWWLWEAIARIPHPMYPNSPTVDLSEVPKGDHRKWWHVVMREHTRVNSTIFTDEQQDAVNRRYSNVLWRTQRYVELYRELMITGGEYTRDEFEKQIQEIDDASELVT